MFRKKKRSFIIMDGSDKDYVKEIRALCKMIMGRVRIKIRKLDGSHPTMKVVTIKTNNCRNWHDLRKILERDHSEQCVFDAPL